MSSEDQVKVRAVRRCQCGKPADHASLCRRDRSGRDGDDQIERIDRQAEERMAREAEEHDRGRRARMARQRQERRRKMTGLELIAEVCRQMQTISTAKAGSAEMSRGGGGEWIGPARQHRLEDDPRWALTDGLIHRHAMTLAELVDEARGYGTASAASMLSAEQKNDAIRNEGHGLTAEELFFRLGPGYGGPSFIRKWRRDNGFDTRGREIEDK